MDCLTLEEFERLARDAVESREAPKLRAHLDQCAACRQKLDECRNHADLAGELRGMGDAAVLRQLGESNDVSTAAILQDTRVAEASDLTSTATPATASVSDSSPGLPPADTFPGYEVLDEISRGGQGAVYRAYQLGAKREVAIKVLRGGSFASENAKRRFEREIELASQLSHPNIVTVFQPGVTATGMMFLVMDYVPGLSLDKYVREKQLALEDVLRLFATICEAVQYAHQRGIIHRDLKPPNILVDHEDRPRVLDFGLARQITPTETDLTGVGQVMGTLPYMSPEQARGHQAEINTLTDVYALGVILYRLLAGRFPYPVEGASVDVLSHIIHTPPTSLSRAWSPESGVRLRYARRPTNTCPIDRDVETIVLRTLQKEPERRYQSAGELGGDIHHYLAGEPIEARRDSTWYVLSKLAKRHWVATATAASVFVIAISSAFISYFFYQDASEALAAKTASDQRLVEQGRQFVADHEAIPLALQRLQLGWFLREWETGRLDQARAIMAETAPRLPEHAAMRFLLDPSISPEQLLEQVPQRAAALAYYVAGERAWQAGQRAEAARWYELCVKDAESGRIAESAMARLEQFQADTANSAPTDGGSEGGSG